MSRSRKRTPIAGITGARSEKWYKKHWHSRFRQAVKRAIRRGDEVLPDEKEFNNPWLAPKDGKKWWFEWEFDPGRFDKLIMRK